MSELSFMQAIRRALAEEFERDDRVVMIGEDIAHHGGPYGTSKGLVERFGPDRLIETPIIESAFFDAAVGMALSGLRPIADFMTADNMMLCVDQIVHAASHFPTLFDISMPLVARAPIGGGLRFAPSHEKSVEMMFLNFPGLKVVYPGTAYDCYGLLKSAVRDDNPVLFFEHKMLYFYSVKSEIPDDEVLLPLGRAEVKRQGRDVTIVTWGWMVLRSLTAAERLAADGIEVEVVDLRTLRPLDRAAICESIAKTHRCLVVQEAPKFAGFGAEVSATIMEYAFDELDAPVARLAAPEIPLVYSPSIQDAYLVDEEQIEAAIRKLVDS